MRTRSIVVRTLPAIAVAACGKILGVDDYAIGPPRPADAGVRHDAASDGSGGSAFNFVDAECGRCVQRECQLALQACQGESECAVWETCMAECPPGDGPREYACLNARRATNREMGEVAACTFQHCYDECKTGGHWPSQGAECGNKLRSQCASAMDVCRQDEVYLDFTRCLFRMNCLVAPPGDAGASASGVLGKSPGCTFQCMDEIRAYEPASAESVRLRVSALFGLGYCAMANAAVYQECREGEDACAEHYDWPTPANLADPIDLKFLVTDAFSSDLPGNPLAGLPIRVCSVGPSGCDDMVGGVPPKTDANGRLTLTLKRYLRQPVYFELLPGSAAAVEKVLYHRGRLLSGDTAFSLAGLEPLRKARSADYQFNMLGDWSPELGAIWANMYGCNMRYRFGAKVLLDGEEVGAAAADGSPYGVVHPAVYHGLAVPMVPSPFPTPNTAGVYIAGVAEGPHKLSAWLGEKMVAELSVWVGRNALSFVQLHPLTTTPTR